MPKQGTGKLGKARQNACPTCKAKVGDYCVSKSGKPTPTSIHRARLALAAKPNFRLEGSEDVAKGARPKRVVRAKWDHSKAGRKAWKTRLRNQRAKVDAAFEPLSNEPTPSTITLGELCQKTIEFLQVTPISSVNLNREGVAMVLGTKGLSAPEGREYYYLTVTLKQA